MLSVRPLNWGTFKSLSGTKLVAYDGFGNEFVRLDQPEEYNEQQITDFKEEHELLYKNRVLALLKMSSFDMGQLVKKDKGKSWWQGRVVGFYSTEDTPEGLCVQLDMPNGPVQIYPASVMKALD